MTRSRFNNRKSKLVRSRHNNHSSSDMPLCKCGCGKPVTRPDNTWLSGHNNVGSNNNMYGKKNPNAGCPSEYRPEMCDEVIYLMSNGYTRKQAAIRMGRWSQTFKDWGEKFPEFDLALKKGQEACEAWWMTEGLTNRNNNKFNTSLYIYLTANFFKWSRTDSSLQVQMSGDSKITHEHKYSGEVKVDIGSVKAVLGVLVRSGCLAAGLTAGTVDRGESGVEAVIDSQDDQVYSAHPNP